MTAEPDALRLVPVDARDLDALRYVLNRSDEASRIRTVMSTFTLPERETTAERLERLYTALKTAAPAVQPAAGREEIEKLIAEASDFTERMISQPWACELIERLVAALAHPPAPDAQLSVAVEALSKIRDHKEEPGDSPPDDVMRDIAATALRQIEGG